MKRYFPKLAMLGLTFHSPVCFAIQNAFASVHVYSFLFHFFSYLELVFLIKFENVTLFDACIVLLIFCNDFNTAKNRTKYICALAFEFLERFSEGTF